MAFKGRHRQLHWTLLARWEAGYKDPWLILTALPPEASTACWDGLRAWIEQGFTITKRGGWQWHRTHMTTTRTGGASVVGRRCGDPVAAERRW